MGEAGSEESELDVHGAWSESCQAEVPERTTGAHQRVTSSVGYQVSLSPFDQFNNLFCKEQNFNLCSALERHFLDGHGPFPFQASLLSQGCIPALKDSISQNCCH